MPNVEYRMSIPTSISISISSMSMVDVDVDVDVEVDVDAQFPKSRRLTLTSHFNIISTV